MRVDEERYDLVQEATALSDDYICHNGTGYFDRDVEDSLCSY